VSGEAAACARLWRAVLFENLRTAGGGRVTGDLHRDVIHARAWVGSPGFREVAALAGYDGEAILARLTGPDGPAHLDRLSGGRNRDGWSPGGFRARIDAARAA